jgi:hypothetical protein
MKALISAKATSPGGATGQCKYKLKSAETRQVGRDCYHASPPNMPSGCKSRTSRLHVAAGGKPNGRCRRQRGLLVPSRARDGAGCLLHRVGMVRPPGTMARLLSGVRRREPRRSGAEAAWRTAWRLGGAEEVEKVVEKAGGGGVACPSWQPRCIS